MDETFTYSQQAIVAGSKSFAKAARLFSPNIRRDVILLYAWCRHCDDVIDGQTSGHTATILSITDKQERLHYLQRETRKAFTDEPLSDPAFDALRQVIGRHKIPKQHIFDLLNGFAMDITDTVFATLDDTLNYSYHVAGVVGVIMANIMGVTDRAVLLRAADLGIAFQLTNITRDIIDDEKIGRCYLPAQWLTEYDLTIHDFTKLENRTKLYALAQRLLSTADAYYESAQNGIPFLPVRSAWAITAAFHIYRSIGTKILRLGPKSWQTRVSTGPGFKIGAIIFSGITVLSKKLLSPYRPVLTQRQNLWTKSTL